ncbi:UDP-N-acetylglucosamine 2-epimerase [Robertmurraya andreesenii]|uniref:GDP/UDP-N,N'-diacetylbacillosamine 2-epimerase (Hydrolyzing) n=1 Tax=Anoxybacillus andreesenii TaxID=1325932 RepID=A0ABT9V7H8_9BACL|nr:UDP-N-acetylglucosamine 2-epimerase [Robertmurraya andreesenii]MDQ0156911.1 GDP/UDP-N,N'-diacetylbacillosamine 2-epimerase (hydrolyzing) [Robertmurraya andreesenii]
MSFKKILAFTGIRSDYDLMSGLYSKINEQEDFEISLIVSGAHLSDTYGYTVQNIREDKIPIIATIENLIDSNSKSSRIKSMSILLQSCIHTVENYKPDLILYPGDREDVMVGALLGAYMNIPTAHFFGGDHATDGHVDNMIRHATSKLSTIHFVSNEYSLKRLIKIGEARERIFNVGSPSLDKFISTPIISKRDLLNKFNKTEWDDYAVVIFHPMPGEEEMALEYFREILIVLEEEGINAFIGYPNVDSGNRDIIRMIEKYNQDENFVIYKNLPRDIFVNILRSAKFLIGNSSAGLYEAPSIPLGVINVGNRQKGRLAAENVIFVNQGIENIRCGIRKVTSDTFQHRLVNVKSPYGEGDSIEQILSILRKIDLRKLEKKTEDPLGDWFYE